MQELIDLLREELQPLRGTELRIACNMVRRALDAVCPQIATPRPAAKLTPMTKGEREVYGKSLIGFGKHNGTPMWHVPRDYLEWLADAKKDEWHQLRRYLMTDEVPQHEDYEDEPKQTTDAE